MSTNTPTQSPGKTPSKKELLNELESIRDFLDDENDTAGIPTLTVVAEPQNTEEQPPAHTKADLETAHESPMASDVIANKVNNTKSSEQKIKANALNNDEKKGSDEAALLDAYAELDDHSAKKKNTQQASPASKKTQPKTQKNTVSNVAPKAAPQNENLSRQSSLFDEPAHKDAPSPTIATADATIASKKEITDHSADHNAPSFSEMPKAHGENPFLPPHIRERLGKHKELFESVPDEMVAALQKRFQDERQSELLQSIASREQSMEADFESAKASDAKKDALIDELVAEYLPIIEEKLRAKLRASTWNEDQ